MLIEVVNLDVFYGEVKALREVTFGIGEGEIVALLGPNGAGKSTALNTVAGLVALMGGTIASGQITFRGQSIMGLRPEQLVWRRLALVPEGRRVFSSLTVFENLELGGYCEKDSRKSRTRMEKVFSLFPELKEKSRQPAGTLSAGEQQMLTLGRSLMIEPVALLLDEPSLGLSPGYVEKVFQKLVEINGDGMTVVLAEQNAHMALQICDRAYIFDSGTVAVAGKKEDLLGSEMITRVFFGGGAK